MSIHLPQIKNSGQKKTVNPFNKNVIVGGNTPKEPSSQQKIVFSPRAFFLNTDVHNNYSAYRLNNNMGIAGTSSMKKIRTGFNGEIYDMDEYQMMKNMNAINPSATNPYTSRTFTDNSPGYYNQQSIFNPGYASPQYYNQFSQPQYTNQPSFPAIPRYAFNLGDLQGDLSARAYPQTDRGPNIPFEQNQTLPISRQTRYTAATKFRDGASSSMVLGNNLTLANQSGFYTQAPSIQNIGDDLHILKSIIEADNKVTQTQTQAQTTILDQTQDLGKDPTRPKTKGKKKGKKGKKGKKTKAQVSDGKPTLYGFLWAMVYPVLWMIDVHIEVEGKRDKVFNEIDQCVVIMVDVIQSQCIDALNSIYNEKKSLVLVSGEEKSVLSGAKEISPKELAQRSKLLLGKLDALLQSMNKLVSEYILPTPLIKFLGMLSSYKGVPPQSFFTEFELSRLQFTNVATLGEMEPIRSKMVIGAFILIRALGYKLLLRPWETVKGMKKKPEVYRYFKA